MRDNGKRIAEVNGQFAGLHTWYRKFSRQLRVLESCSLDNQMPGVSNTAEYLPYGVVVARLVDRANRLRAGDPTSPKTEIAPLANRAGGHARCL